MVEIKKILKMSVDERIHLVQTIWDSIAVETETSPISADHKNILKERMEAHDKNPEDVVSWDEVKEAAKKLL